MIGVHVTVLKHLSGPEFCILEINGKDETNTYKSSFSFSLKYFFNSVLPEHRVWFLNKIVEHYLKIEIKADEVQFEIKNEIDALVHCSDIYENDVDSKK